MALLFSGCNCARQRGVVGHTAIEALVLEDAALDLGRGHPTPMHGCVVKLELPGDPPRFGRRERFVPRRELMRMEMIQHHAKHRGFWIAFVRQP
jgi:hypothetical protein